MLGWGCREDAKLSIPATVVLHYMFMPAEMRSYSFRRGSYPSTIFSLSFGPSIELPDILVATGSSGSVHAFSLGFALCKRSKRSSIILGSIIPESVSDVLDPAHHGFLHSAAPAGVKRCDKRNRKGYLILKALCWTAVEYFVLKVVTFQYVEYLRLLEYLKNILLLMTVLNVLN